MKKALDGKSVESISSDGKQPQDSHDDSDVATSVHLNTVDTVGVDELRQWQTRAMAAEQTIREAQDSMASTSSLILIRIFILIQMSAGEQQLHTCPDRWE